MRPTALGIELSPTPAVGTDLPPYEPDAALAVDDVAARVLGEWYSFFDAALARPRPALGAISPATLWPEHFDLAVTIELTGGPSVNIGCSPGDSFSPEPYAYVGPWDRTLTAAYGNAPFGAIRTRSELATRCRRSRSCRWSRAPAHRR